MSRDGTTTTTLTSIASSVASSIASTIATFTTSQPTEAPTEAPTSPETTIPTTVLTTSSSALTTLYTIFFSSTSTPGEDPNNKGSNFIDENSSWFWYVVGGGVLALSAITAAAVYNRRKSHSPRVEPTDLELVVHDQRIQAISRLDYQASDMAKIATDYQELEKQCKSERRRCPKIEDFTTTRFQEKMEELRGKQDEIHRANEAQPNKKLKLTPDQIAQIDDSAAQLRDLEAKKYNTFILLHESVEEKLHELTLKYCRQERIDARSDAEGRISFQPDKRIQFDMIQSRINEARSVFYDVVECHLPQIIADTLGEKNSPHHEIINPRDLLADKEAFRANAMKHLAPSIEIANALSDALEHGYKEDTVYGLQLAAVAKYSEEAIKLHRVKNPRSATQRATAAAVAEVTGQTLDL